MNHEICHIGKKALKEIRDKIPELRSKRTKYSIGSEQDITSSSEEDKEMTSLFCLNEAINMNTISMNKHIKVYLKERER